jgi:adenosine deaminase
MEVREIPKAELHLHIEGTLEPELAFELARRNGVGIPWKCVDELRSRYDFASLPDFLDLYYQCMAVLRTRRDFFDLASAYFDRAAADEVAHAEVFFDPQVHLRNGIPLADVVGGLADAFAAAWERHGISGGLIMCFLRDEGPESAAQLLRAAEPFAPQLIGVGMDSAEVGFPPEPYAPVFARARELGLHTVAHGGEEGGPEYIAGALDALGVERVDHGLHALDDPVLAARLAREQVPLTCCPLSNVRLQAVPSLAEHPIAQMLERGLLVTVNSDDPAYFGGYIGANFEAVIDAFELSDQVVARLCRNSITASFASPERKAELLAAVDAAAGCAL